MNGWGARCWLVGAFITLCGCTTLPDGRGWGEGANDATRVALNAGLTAMTIGTSWARIEAGWHYPSDTLFSLALGNFLASFVNDAFLGLLPTRSALRLSATHEGATLQWHARF